MRKESGGRKRRSTGEYELTVSNADALEAVHEGGHIVTTKEVADTLGKSKDTALRRLKALHDDGIIRRKEIGAGTVWWVENNE